MAVRHRVKQVMSNYLIGGASAGLGADLVRTLAPYAEHELFLLTHSAAQLNAFLDSLGTSLKATCHVIEIDFSRPELIIERLSVFPQMSIDFFVYLVSVAVPKAVYEITRELNQSIFNINYIFFVECVRFLLCTKPKHRPLKIIVLSALEVSYSLCHNTIFIASKAAINTYVRHVAPEMQEYATTINAIAPVFSVGGLVGNEEICVGQNSPFLLQVSGGIKPRKMIATIEFLLKSDSYNGVVLPVNSSAD